MKNQLKIGSVVGIFRTGMVGEVIEIINREDQIKYHVKVPSEGETYSYVKNDLHLFSELGEKNIRDEWQREGNKSVLSAYEAPGYIKNPLKTSHARYTNFLDRIKFIAKIMVFSVFFWSVNLVTIHL